MARIFALASLVVAAAASNHASDDPGLPFALGSGGQQGVGFDVGAQDGGGELGNYRDVILGGGKSNDVIGNGGFNGHSRGQSISVTIITTNVGGGAKYQVWNEPPMQQGKEHRVCASNHYWKWETPWDRATDSVPQTRLLLAVRLVLYISQKP